MDPQHAEGEGNLRKAKPSLLSSQLSLALEKAKPLIPDGGYGWVVVFATFTIYGIAEGVSFVFGLLYVEFLNEFKASKSATSWIGSLFMALPLIAGPVCSALVDKFGCQKMTVLGSFICAMGFVLSAYAQSIGILYITFGVIGGLARGLVYITVVVSVAFWFEKRRAVALGISAAGTGVGTVVFAPITAYLISEFQWRGTVLILAGFLLNMCVCGVLMIDPQWVKDEEREAKMKKRRMSIKKDVQELKKLLNEENNKLSNTTDNKREHFDTRTASTDDKKWYHDILDIIKAFGLFFELHFLLLCLGILIAGTWFLVPYFYLADHMKSNQYSDEHASFSLSAIGFANTIGMVALGWLGDRFNVAKVFGISLILCGCSIWGIMFFTNFYIPLIISCAFFGFFFASCFALSPALLSQLVPLDEFTMGYGLILLCEGIGHMIGPPLAGLVTDLTGSWTKSFYLAGFWVLLSGVLIGIIPFVTNRRLFGKSKLIWNNENNGNHNTV